MIHILTVVDPVHTVYPLALMLYTGPDQMLPILSFLGAALGFILMWWRRLLMLARKALKGLSRKPDAPTEQSK